MEHCKDDAWPTLLGWLKTQFQSQNVHQIFHIIISKRYSESKENAICEDKAEPCSGQNGLKF